MASLDNVADLPAEVRIREASLYHETILYGGLCVHACDDHVTLHTLDIVKNAPA